MSSVSNDPPEEEDEDAEEIDAMTHQSASPPSTVALERWGFTVIGDVTGLDADGYTKDWSTIADRKKAQRNYTCQRCRADLNSDRAILHVHHVDRDKQDNSDANLLVLCALCHSEEEYHSHLRAKITPQQLAAIRRARQRANEA